jgi:hypothetical protein
MAEFRYLVAPRPRARGTDKDLEMTGGRIRSDLSASPQAGIDALKFEGVYKGGNQRPQIWGRLEGGNLSPQI